MLSTDYITGILTGAYSLAPSIAIVAVTLFVDTLYNGAPGLAFPSVRSRKKVVVGNAKITRHLQFTVFANFGSVPHGAAFHSSSSTYTFNDRYDQNVTF